MEKSPRNIGDELEDYVLSTLPNTRKTKGSGSVRGDGDLHQGEDYLVECKNKMGTCQGISITGAEVKKGIQQALKKNRRPVFILKNAQKDIWACIPYRELVSLIQGTILRCARCGCDRLNYQGTTDDPEGVSYDRYVCEDCSYGMDIY